MLIVHIGNTINRSVEFLTDISGIFMLVGGTLAGDDLEGPCKSASQVRAYKVTDMEGDEIGRDDRSGVERFSGASAFTEKKTIVESLK